MEPTSPTPVAVPTKATKTPVAPQPLPVQPPVTTAGNEGGSKVLVVILSLLLLGALAAAGFFYYKAEEYKATISQREAEELARKLPVAESILPSPGYGVSMYASSTEYEKGLVHGYLQAYPAYVQAIESDSPGIEPESRVNIRYYDERTALIETQGSKLCIYDVRTFEQIGDSNDCLRSPQNYFRDYIFETQSKEILYYKKGALSFKLLPEAELRAPNETYAAVDGAGGLGGDVAFNESTKELEIGVFDSRYTDNGSSTKRLRTAKFLLP